MNLDFLIGLYADAVRQGKRTLDSVPDVVKDKVAEAIKESKNSYRNY